MACLNQVGVKNILITFTDCDTDEVIGPISHELAGEEQPTYRTCEYTNEPMTNGRVMRNKSNQSITVTVERNLGISLAYYQGCARIDMQIEHFDGRVYSAENGTATGEEESDGSDVTITAVFEEIDELLPVGAPEAVAA